VGERVPGFPGSFIFTGRECWVVNFSVRLGRTLFSISFFPIEVLKCDQFLMLRLVPYLPSFTFAYQAFLNFIRKYRYFLKNIDISL
jgi:hypothetical protein